MSRVGLALGHGAGAGHLVRNVRFIAAGLKAVRAFSSAKPNKTLEQENEILRRAAAYFAREISPK